MPPERSEDQAEEEVIGDQRLGGGPAVACVHPHSDMGSGTRPSLPLLPVLLLVLLLQVSWAGAGNPGRDPRAVGLKARLKLAVPLLR